MLRQLLNPHGPLGPLLCPQISMTQKHFVLIRSGPWKGTMIRFATPEQLKTVKRASRSYNLVTWKLLDTALCAQFPECLETK
jgi:hypothetical protein